MREHFTFHALGGPGSVCIDGLAREQAQRAITAMLAEIDRIEKKYSRYRPDSLISQLNAAAGNNAIKVDAETTHLLSIAEALHEQSEGRFDATSGVLRNVWDFKRGIKPSQEELQACLALVSWSDVDISQHRQETYVRLKRHGMQLDFGGFAKEFAADRSAAVLQAHGVSRGYVELAGDLLVIGPQHNDEPWSIGIRHPRVAQQSIARIAVEQGGLATSGDYARYMVFDGIRYSHIFDARTGMPVEHLPSVSVQAPTCLMAGALTTLALLQGEQGLTWLSDCPDPWLAVDHQLRCHSNAIQHI